MTAPTGRGNSDIEIVRDGFTPPVGSSDTTQQYATYTGGGARSTDWIGYQFATQHTFSGLTFQEGIQFPDGGWFTTLNVQVRVGGTWTNVQNLQSTPPYAGADGINYESYDLSFTPISGDRIRITGTPGGSAQYVTVAELLAFESSVLPIQLSSFTATVVSPTQVRLDWTTVSEINNFGFEVERSSNDTSEFTTLPNSFVSGHGTTNEQHNYASQDVAANAAFPYYRLKQIDLDGTQHFTEPVLAWGLTSVPSSVVPVSYALHQNYPNPFNPVTTIAFDIPELSHVTLDVYDILGKKVVTLVDCTLTAGKQTVEFSGENLADGIYIYALRAGNYTDVKKMVLLK